MSSEYCGDYAAEHEITFNCNKTIGVLFCPKKYKQPAPSNALLNGVRVQVFAKVKYISISKGIALFASCRR